MPATTERLAELFRAAGGAHHRAFLAANGDDPEWPRWYAEWLAPRLAEQFRLRFDVAELAGLLVRAEDERKRRGIANWPAAYAEFFLTAR